MTSYYNEFDPYAAQWLRNLINAGHIAPGVVDERSIEDVVPSDLEEFTQCHFFAGIGVWSLALRRAGWPDDRPVWTGSCPCQPFSAAGAGAGFADARHLWPTFAWLIKQRRPAIVFGEQVASKAVEPWVDLVHADLEALGYAFGAIPFPSAGVGAPHIRDRLFWVAYSKGNGHQWAREFDESAGRDGPSHLCAVGGLDDSAGARRERSEQDAEGYSRNEARLRLLSQGYRQDQHGSACQVNGFWGGADWISCRDDRFRPVEPGTFPLVARPSGELGRVQSRLGRIYGGNRTGRLKGYGNAINAEAARVFIEAVMECRP